VLSVPDRSCPPGDHRTRDHAAIEALVLDAVAMAARLERCTIELDTPVLAANLDSLTLIAALTQIELACSVSFDTEELIELLRATDLRELSALVARKVEASLRTKSP
jgi:hypothetical protein